MTDRFPGSNFDSLAATANNQLDLAGGITVALNASASAETASAAAVAASSAATTASAAATSASATAVSNAATASAASSSATTSASTASSAATAATTAASTASTAATTATTGATTATTQAGIATTAATASALALATVSNRMVGEGIYNYTSLNLKNWRKAAAKVRTGTGRGTVLWMGDSTTIGQGAGTGGTKNLTGAYARAFPNVTATLLNSWIPTSTKSFLGDQNSFAPDSTALATYDPRMAQGTGWGRGSTSLGGAMMRFTTGGGAGTLSFTPAGSIDNFKIIYLRQTTYGTFTTNIDVAASLGTTNAAGAASIQTVSYSVALGAHTIKINAQNDGNLDIIGIVAWDSTVPAIDFLLAGHSGAKADTFYNSGSSQAWTAYRVIANVAPDLTFINCTINNSNNDGSSAPTLAAYSTAIQAVITAAQATGDVVLMVGPPSTGTPATDGTLDAYIATLLTLATTNGCVLLSLKDRWVSYAAIQPYFPYFDGLHPNYTAYSDIAQALYQIFTRA